MAGTDPHTQIVAMCRSDQAVPWYPGLGNLYSLSRGALWQDARHHTLPSRPEAAACQPSQQTSRVESKHPSATCQVLHNLESAPGIILTAYCTSTLPVLLVSALTSLLHWSQAPAQAEFDYQQAAASSHSISRSSSSQQPGRQGVPCEGRCWRASHVCVLLRCCKWKSKCKSLCIIHDDVAELKLYASC